MSDIYSILYCNEELCEDDDNKKQQHIENSNPLFEILYYHHSSRSFPFSNGLLEVRINRFIEGEYTIIAILNPIVCSIYDISNHDGITSIMDIQQNKGDDVFLTCDWITMKDKDNLSKLFLLIGCKSGIINVYDVISRQFMCAINDHKGSVHFVRSVKHNSPLFLSIGDDNILRLWNIGRKKPYRMKLKKSTPPYYSMTVSSTGNRVSLFDSNNTHYIFDICGTKLYQHTVESKTPKVDELDEKSMKKLERYRSRQEKLLEPFQQPLRNRFVLTDLPSISWLGSYFINALERYPVSKNDLVKHFHFISNELKKINPNLISQLSVCSNGLFVFTINSQFVDIFQIKDTIVYYSTVMVVEEMGKPIRAYFLETSERLLVITNDYTLHYLIAENIPKPAISFTPSFCNLIELIHAIQFKERMGLYKRPDKAMNGNEHATFEVFPFSDELLLPDYPLEFCKEEQLNFQHAITDLPFTTPEQSLIIVTPFIEGDFSSVGGLPSLEEVEHFITICKNQKRKSNLEKKRQVFDNPDMLPPPPRKPKLNTTVTKQENRKEDVPENKQNNSNCVVDNGSLNKSLSEVESEADYYNPNLNTPTILFNSDIPLFDSFAENVLFPSELPFLDTEEHDISMLPSIRNTSRLSFPDDNMPISTILGNEDFDCTEYYGNDNFTSDVLNNTIFGI